MATLKFSTFLFILFFIFLPNHAATSNTACRKRTCASHGPSIRFPFWLRDSQPPDCGFSGNYNLSCNPQKQTILTLPASGDFILRYVDYSDQVIIIDDPDECLPRRFLEQDFSLTNSTFLYMSNSIGNYTFIHCPTQEDAETFSEYASPLFSCLCSEAYNVIAVPTAMSSSASSSSSPCSVISTALVPLESFVWDWVKGGDLVVVGVTLAWDVPDCRSCEGKGGHCGWNAYNSQLVCFPHKGLSSNAKFGIIVGLGIPGVFCLLALALYVRERIATATDQLPQHTSEFELSTLTNVGQQASVTNVGLDGRTLESYPKTQLGESLELPEPKDKTCPICLSEYQAKETLRTIPECNHYFHASCVDEWLGKNATCPLCRNLPGFLR